MSAVELFRRACHAIDFQLLVRLSIGLLSCLTHGIDKRAHCRLRQRHEIVVSHPHRWADKDYLVPSTAPRQRKTRATSSHIV
jgi:hypothetical protein